MKLKERWATRLAHIILPYADEMPEVSLRMTLPNPMREICDMFGGNRWSGLKSHVNNIERGIRMLPSLLVPDTKKMLTLANKLEEKGVAPSAPMKIAKSLEWLAKRTGTEVLTPSITEKFASVSQKAHESTHKDTQEGRSSTKRLHCSLGSHLCQVRQLGRRVYFRPFQKTSRRLVQVGRWPAL